MNPTIMNKLHRAVTSSSLDALLVIDHLGEIVMTNPATQRMLGYPDGALIGEDITVIMPEPHRSRHAEYVASYMKTGERKMIGRNRVVDVLRADGTTFPAELTVTEADVMADSRSSDVAPLEDPDDRVFFVGTLRDVSETMASAELMGSILAVVLDPLVVITDTGIITMVNDATCNMFGYAIEDMVGSNVSMLMPEAIAKHHDGYLKRYKESGATRAIGTNRPVECRRNDGTTFMARLGLSEVDCVGKHLYVGLLHDLTLEMKQKETEAMAMAERTKSELRTQFLANMSHEIRTPLNGVLGLLELLRLTPLDPVQTSWVETSLRSATALTTILDDILLFSRADANSIQLENMPFSVRDVVEDILLVLSPAADETALNFVYNVGPAVPDFVIGDPTRFRQILINLTGNALKFTHAGEVALEVFLDTENTDALGDPNAIMLRVEVSDTGIGIPKDTVASLFTPFTQADASTTRKYGGTGLGLSIVKKLVDLFEGDIHVDSRVGRGSTFTFTCKFARDPASYSCSDRFSITADEQAKLANARILVIDDNAVNCDYFSVLLTKLGCKVDTFRDPLEGINALKMAAIKDSETPYTVCLLDFHMPRMSGPEVAAVIADSPTLVASGLIVIMLGSIDVRPDVFRYPAVQAFVTKPLRRSSLLKVIGKALDDGPVMAAAASSSSSSSSLPPGSGSSGANRSGANRSGANSSGNADNADTDGPTGPHVLVVDDNLVNLLCLEEILHQKNARTVTAMNGLEAYERTVEAAAANEPIDLILLDLHMPVQNGQDAAQSIRDWESKTTGLTTSPIPIIAVTADTTPGLRQELVESGLFNGFLNKPVRFDTLFQMIGNISPHLEFAAAGRASQPAVRPVSVAGPADAPGSGGGLDAAAAASTSASTSASASVISSTQPTVLVIDDASATRMVLNASLSMMGCRVLEAPTGEAGIEITKTEPHIDIILCDLRMPSGMSGVQTSSALRELGCTVPIIGMTADKTTLDLKAQTSDAGMNEVHEKPLNMAILDRLLARHVGVFGTRTRTSSELAVVDISPLLELVNGDTTLAISILDELKRETAKAINRLRPALSALQFDTANEIAHNIKGAAAAGFAMPLSSAAAALQKHCLNHDEDAASASFQTIVRELHKLVQATRAGIDGLVSSKAQGYV